MNKLLTAVVLAIFILPSTAVMADYGDDLKKREAQKLEENHKNPTPKPAGTSPAPTNDTSGMPGNSKSPREDSDISGTNQQDPNQRR